MYEILCRSTERPWAMADWAMPARSVAPPASQDLVLHMRENRSQLSNPARQTLAVVVMVLAKAGLLKGKMATSHWVTRPVLADFGAIPTDERVVRDGNVVTGAGVSAGLDFAIALVEALRGRAYALALMLQVEYAPHPPLLGGTLATTPPDVGQMMAR